MSLEETKKMIVPSSEFVSTIEEKSGERVSACYQCKKCTNGCPVTFVMDIMPNQVMRMVQLGMDDEVLRSSTIWVCASCETCTTRCPNDIDIAHLMDALRQTAIARNIPPKEKDIYHFHRVFLENVRIVGRLYEPGMLGALKALTRSMSLGEVRLGIGMFLRGKLRLIPQFVRASVHMPGIFAKAKQRKERQGQ